MKISLEPRVEVFCNQVLTKDWLVYDEQQPLYRCDEFKSKIHHRPESESIKEKYSHTNRE